jgi:paraquat-inducible protein A
VIACPDCDLLLHKIVVDVGDKVHCPRCGYLLQRARRDSVERSFALSLAGLLLVLPANVLPLVTIRLLENSHSGTLWSGVIALFHEQMWGVAILVFLSSILFPLVNIVLALLVSGHLYFNRPHRWLRRWLHWLEHLEEWAMLEVYLLGIIVACVKLSSMAILEFGFGLYAFIALLVVMTLLASSLDNYLFWQRVTALNS